MRSVRQASFYLLLTVVLLGLYERIAWAQAMPTAIGPGSYVAVGGALSAFPSGYDGRNIVGGTVFMDVQPTFRYGFEGEARFLRYRTNEGVQQSNYLVGVHVGLSPKRLRPYAKFLAGATRISAPFGYADGTFFTYVPGGGADYLLTDRITARLIDVEYQVVPQFIGSSIRNVGASIGFSYRINGLSRLPRGTTLRR